MRLLVCDLTPPTPSLSPQLLGTLRADGFEIETTTTSADATWRATETSYAALLVATASIGNDMIDAITMIRAAGVTVPVILISPAQDTAWEARALDAGADDHLRSPVTPALLIARLRAHRRRTGASPASPLRAGQFTLDPVHLVATTPDDRQVDLTQREFAVIELLARRAPEPVDKLTILDAVWGFDFEGDPNVVEVYIGYLRKKLGRATIHTVRGVGYRVAEA